ncbi:hypothetical protein EGW08_005056 [Elysia chlorotica]|uniref:CUB domain-containing protein n=1 Tax=Elysia chlorotica TaxID=188477 RepID=A0A3S1AB36_ELYCH|nr:hypothetical protein EGW08_005056 [Elysia chlorotica]
MYSRLAFWGTLLLYLMLPPGTTKLFKVHSSTGRACVLLDIDFRIFVTATRDGEKVGEFRLFPDASVRASGNCRHSIRWIRLEFLAEESLYFVFDIRDESIILHREFKFSPQFTFSGLCSLVPSFVNFKDNRVLNIGEVGTSYRCSTEYSSFYTQIGKIPDTEDVCSYTVDVDILSMQVQAYFVNQSRFSAPTECTPPTHRRRNWAQGLVGGVTLCFLLAGVLSSLCLQVVCKLRCLRAGSVWERLQSPGSETGLTDSSLELGQRSLRGL